MLSRCLRTPPLCPSYTVRLLIGRRMVSEKFIVRKMSSPEEVRDIMCERSASEGWRPGALDHVNLFAADERGFFVGELEGKPISCMCVIKCSHNFAFLGNYIVDKPYRGDGYGFQTWKIAMASINENYNTGGDAVIDNVPIYVRIGFQPVWCEQRVDLVASKVASTLSDIKPLQAVSIHPASKDKFHDILDYDTTVFAFPRQSFLDKWIFAPNCHASVAFDSNGKVAGYAVVRTTLRREDGWRIGPLFADNSQIARSLYRDICDKVAAEDPNGVIAIDVPYGKPFNPDTLRLVDELSGKPIFKCMRIYKMGIPLNMKLEKMFGLTALELG